MTEFLILIVAVGFSIGLAGSYAYHKIEEYHLKARLKQAQKELKEWESKVPYQDKA